MSSAEFKIPEHRGSKQYASISHMVSDWANVPVSTVIGLGLIFAVAFISHVDLASENDKVGLDSTVMVKLGLLGLGGIYGFLGFVCEPKVRKVLFSSPVGWMTFIFGLFCVSVLFSPTKAESLASTISIACVLLLTVTAIVRIGVYQVLDAIFLAMSAFIFFSWVAFLVFPEIGIFDEPITDGEFTRRMGGLAHPNTLGQFAGLTIVIGCLLYYYRNYRSWWRVLIIALAVGALVGSLSRTSYLATALAIGVIFRNQLLKQKWVIYAAWLGVLGIVGIVLLSFVVDLSDVIGSKLAMVSKSGDAEELTSGTGRSEIWSYTIELIGRRPLTGYGAATSKIYLQDYSLYTHNLILNIAFSTGIIGAFAAVAMCLGRIVALFKSYHPFGDAMVVFILVNGLMENVIFSILAGFPTIIWVFGMCVRKVENLENEQLANVISYRAPKSMGGDQ